MSGAEEALDHLNRWMPGSTTAAVPTQQEEVHQGTEESNERSRRKGTRDDGKMWISESPTQSKESVVTGP